MPRFSRLLLTVLVGLSGTVLLLGAQTSDESKTAPKSHQRAVSKNVATALAARMPKYNPPKEEPKKPVDNRVDKPRNKIIRLPEYVVHQDKAPVFRERDIHTKSGLKKLAMKRYFSETSMALSSFNIPFLENLAENYALMLYQQDERLKNIFDLNETADDIERVDPENAEELRKGTRDTYRRTFGYENWKYE